MLNRIRMRRVSFRRYDIMTKPDHSLGNDLRQFRTFGCRFSDYKFSFLLFFSEKKRLNS